ncbi:protein phosphatase 2C domain-containing protein [Streptosporangium sp. NPDC002524]|uniref:protein phosphatase 2C domain-containing protein n=1 Tax=Streptosporangium sp. NPDC002524 TaxID=3154537 RepID=UPI00332EB4EA
MTPPPRSSTPRVLTAERPGGPGASEDRIFLTPNAAVVLDGATSVELGPGSGGWYADSLGRLLEELIAAEPHQDLRKLLAHAIEGVATAYDLEAGKAPSSTVAVLRWDENELEALVLGDSAVVVFDRAGGVEVLQDSRILEIRNEPREAYLTRLRSGEGYRDDSRELMRSFQSITRSHRNREGGYWIAEATPDAGFHARVRRWPRSTTSAVLIATDGVVSGVEEYGVPTDWPAALDVIMTQGPDALTDMIHEAEESDPDASRWPRFKPHDDKALALLLFD